MPSEMARPMATVGVMARPMAHFGDHPPTVGDLLWAALVDVDRAVASSGRVAHLLARRQETAESGRKGAFLEVCRHAASDRQEADESERMIQKAKGSLEVACTRIVLECQEQQRLTNEDEAQKKRKAKQPKKTGSFKLAGALRLKSMLNKKFARAAHAGVKPSRRSSSP